MQLMKQHQRVATPATIQSNRAEVVLHQTLMATWDAQQGARMLGISADMLGGADPVAHDDMRYYVEVFKMVSGMVIKASAVEAMSR